MALKKLAITATAFAILMVVAPISSASAAKKLSQVTVSLEPFSSVTQFPIVAAQKLGFAKKNGVKFDFSASNEGQVLVADGKADLQAGPGAGILSELTGVPLRTLTVNNIYFIGGIYTPKTITSASQLKGKVFATTPVNIIVDLAKAWLKFKGVNPTTVTFVGNPANVADSLLGGTVQAAFVTTPSTTLLPKGKFNDLGNLTLKTYPFPFSGLETSQAWASSHQKVANECVKAVDEALAYMPKHVDRVAKLLSSYVKVPYGPRLVSAFKYALKFLIPSGKISKSTAYKILKFGAQVGTVATPPKSEIGKFFAPTALKKG